MFSTLWNSIIINPMLNALLGLYDLLGNFLLAIAVFTIITRVIMLPMNLRQQRSMAKSQEMGPQIRAIQQKYRDNPQKMQEEFAKIGYNPAESLAGCLPMLATMPILFGLFQVLQIVLGSTPQSLLELTQRVWPFMPFHLSELLPIDSQFLWMNLGQPDPYYILPVLVMVTMFIQTRLSTPARTEPAKPANNKQQQPEDPTAAMTQSMQYTMPLMFGFFSLSFQSGLSIYFILGNLIGIAQGYYTRKVMEKEKQNKNTQTQGMVVDVVNPTETNGRPPTSDSTESTAKRNKKKKK